MGEHTERPILFSSAMVQAILAGRKTQTRRVVKPQPFGDMTNALTGVREWLWTKASRLLGRDTPLPIEQLLKFCPYGVPGDRLWVRETWADCRDMTAEEQEQSNAAWESFRTGNADIVTAANMIPVASGEPRPLYKADFGDYKCDWSWKPSIHMPRKYSRITLEIEQVRVERIQEISQEDAVAEGRQCIAHLHETWDALNEKRGFGWDANPFCWVLTFKRV